MRGKKYLLGIKKENAILGVQIQGETQKNILITE